MKIMKEENISGKYGNVKERRIGKRCEGQI
jgi:hypothetical protein